MYRLIMRETGAGTATNTTPAIGPYISFDRRNTNQSTSVTIEITRMSANWHGSTGKSMRATMTMTMTMTMTAGTVAGMKRTGTTEATKVMSTATIDVVRAVRRVRLLIACGLLLTPHMAVYAADDEAHPSAISIRVRSFGEAVRRDARALGNDCREGAHRTAVAAKTWGQRMATVAKRSAAETRSAFRGEKANTPAS
jgi:hypothetical protein